MKIWTDLSSVLSGITRVTDGRTDGQTDGRTDRILLDIPRLHYMQRGKNTTAVKFSFIALYSSPQRSVSTHATENLLRRAEIKQKFYFH